MRLENKVAIVTGGGRGIGRACALRLAEDGAKAAISYQASTDGANAAVEEIGGGGGQAITVRADLTKNDDVQKLLSAAEGSFGQQIDVLIHVTGGLVARKSIEEMDEAHWQNVMDLNATSLFRTPHMPDGSSRRDRGGSFRHDRL